MYSYQEVLEFVKNSDQLPPLTDNPKVNFLIDKAADENLNNSLNNYNWENDKEKYQNEVERLKKSHVNLVSADSILD